MKVSELESLINLDLNPRLVKVGSKYRLATQGRNGYQAVDAGFPEDIARGSCSFTVGLGTVEQCYIRALEFVLGEIDAD